MSDIELRVRAVCMISHSVLTQPCKESQRGAFTCPWSHSRASAPDFADSGMHKLSITPGSKLKTK